MGKMFRVVGTSRREEAVATAQARLRRFQSDIPPQPTIQNEDKQTNQPSNASRFSPRMGGDEEAQIGNTHA